MLERITLVLDLDFWLQLECLIFSVVDLGNGCCGDLMLELFHMNITSYLLRREMSFCSLLATRNEISPITSHFEILRSVILKCFLVP